MTECVKTILFFFFFIDIDASTSISRIQNETRPRPSFLEGARLQQAPDDIVLFVPLLSSGLLCGEAPNE